MSSTRTASPLIAADVPPPAPCASCAEPRPGRSLPASRPIGRVAAAMRRLWRRRPGSLRHGSGRRPCHTSIDHVTRQQDRRRVAAATDAIRPSGRRPAGASRSRGRPVQTLLPTVVLIECYVRRRRDPTRRVDDVGQRQADDGHRGRPGRIAGQLTRAERRRPSIDVVADAPAAESRPTLPIHGDGRPDRRPQRSPARTRPSARTGRTHRADVLARTAPRPRSRPPSPASHQRQHGVVASRR